MAAPVMKGEEKGVKDLAYLLGHPLRCRCQTYLCERVASPNELAQKFGRSIGDVSYQVRVLEEAGCIELVRTEPRRGAVEHFYRATDRTALTATEYAKLSIAERLDFTRGTLRLGFSDALTSAADGTLVRRQDHHVARQLGTVDQEGWEKIGAIYEEAFERANAEIEAAASRMAGDPALENFPIRVLTMVIEMPGPV